MVALISQIHLFILKQASMNQRHIHKCRKNSTHSRVPINFPFLPLHYFHENLIHKKFKHQPRTSHDYEVYIQLLNCQTPLMHLRLLKSCIQHLNSIIPLMLQCMAINPPFPWLPTLAFHFKNELNKISHHHDIIAGCNISPLTISFFKMNCTRDSHHHEHHAMAATSLH